jgi:molybdenum cofactor synthesis domain-containing protein
VKRTVAVLIISDRAASGEREDQCLPVVQSVFADSDYAISDSAIVPDDSARIESELMRMVSKGFDLILTSGGTGCGPRDITPGVTLKLLDKPTPGLDEAIRAFSRTKTSNAMFSRAVSGVAGKSFIVNLPGSPVAVREILEFLLPSIDHPLNLISGKVKDCRREMGHND